MKKQFHILFIAFLFSGSFLKAQTAENWEPVTLNINGTNGFNGVDAHYALTTCNNNEIIIVELTNHNSYPVKACWKDIVINTVDQRLTYSNVQDSVLISPNTTLVGDCSGSNLQLAMKLTDFGILKEDFKAYMMSNFDFVVIH